MLFLKNIIFLIFLSTITTTLLWTFNFDVFSYCYIPNRDAIAVSIAPETNLEECLLISASTVLAIQIFIPLTITMISVIAYWLYNKKNLSYRYYLLWLAWIGTVYYIAEYLNFMI